MKYLLCLFWYPLYLFPFVNNIISLFHMKLLIFFWIVGKKRVCSFVVRLSKKVYLFCLKCINYCLETSESSIAMHSAEVEKTIHGAVGFNSYHFASVEMKDNLVIQKKFGFVACRPRNNFLLIFPKEFWMRSTKVANKTEKLEMGSKSKGSIVAFRGHWRIDAMASGDSEENFVTAVDFLSECSMVVVTFVMLRISWFLPSITSPFDIINTGNFRRLWLAKECIAYPGNGAAATLWSNFVDGGNTLKLSGSFPLSPST